MWGTENIERWVLIWLLRWFVILFMWFIFECIMQNTLNMSWNNHNDAVWMLCLLLRALFLFTNHDLLRSAYILSVLAALVITECCSTTSQVSSVLLGLVIGCTIWPMLYPNQYGGSSLLCSQYSTRGWSFKAATLREQTLSGTLKVIVQDSGLCSVLLSLCLTWKCCCSRP